MSGMATQEPAAAAQPATRRRPIGTIVVLAIIAIFIIGYVASKHSEAKKTNAARAYCATTQIGHTTMLNTTMTLGQPDSTVTHDGFRYLGYGKVTFSYVWTGYQDSSVRAAESGC
jgi:hypothetical protein